MSSAISNDLRERAVEAVEKGASRRSVAKRFCVSVSSVGRWCRLRSRTGKVDPLPRGGDDESPCMKRLSRKIFYWLGKQPTITPDEICRRFAQQGQRISRNAVCRLIFRENNSSKGGGKSTKRKELVWLTRSQVKRIKRFFPKPRGNPRVDDLVVLSGIMYVLRYGVPWHLAPAEYGPYKTLYNRWKRWSDMGIFEDILLGLASQSRKTHTLMMDATHIKVHRIACSLSLLPRGKAGKKGRKARKIGRTKGGLNCKLHIVTDAEGRPILMFLTAGQVSDYTGARVLSRHFPKAKVFVADRGYDANWLRNLLEDMGIKHCIPPRSHRKEQIPYDREIYKSRNKVERCFSRLKDWRRVATRYDRCPKVFFSTCAFAAVVKFWL